MASTTNQLEDVLAQAGLPPEAAQPLIEQIQRVVQESVALQADASVSEPESGETVVSLEGRMIRMERKIDDLQARTEHLHALTEQKVDSLHELMNVQFAHVDHRFKEIDDRLDRERRERWGFVTAAAGAITAGLLRVFGAI